MKVSRFIVISSFVFGVLFVLIFSSLSKADSFQAYAVGGVGMISKSTDSGLNWSSQSSGTTDYLMDVDFIDADTGWAVGMDGTILHTTDGGANWSSQSSGAGYLKSVDFIDANTGWASGANYDVYDNGYERIFYTTDGGANWSEHNTNHASFSNLDFVDANTGWAIRYSSSWNQTVFYTTDGGASWSSQSIISSPTSDIHGIDFIDANTGWAVGRFGDIFHTTDGGSNWISQNSGTSNILVNVDFVDANTGWATGENGTLLHTIDGGLNWTSQIFTDTVATSTAPTIDFVDNLNGILATEFKIFSTTDGGATWNENYTSSSYINNVTAVVVPEPISFILFVTGGSLLAGRRFIKRRKKA